MLWKGLITNEPGQGVGAQGGQSQNNGRCGWCPDHRPLKPDKGHPPHNPAKPWLLLRNMLELGLFKDLKTMNTWTQTTSTAADSARPKTRRVSLGSCDENYQPTIKKNSRAVQRLATDSHAHIYTSMLLTKLLQPVPPQRGTQVTVSNVKLSLKMLSFTQQLCWWEPGLQMPSSVPSSWWGRATAHHLCRHFTCRLVTRKPFYPCGFIALDCILFTPKHIST